MIIGGPGAGKTWLAGELERRLGLPVICIDDFVHDRAGQFRAPNLIDADCRAAADGPRWIMEGGNSRTYAFRAARAHCLVRLNPPVWSRLWRVALRDWGNWRLLAWTWRYNRVFGPRDRAVLDASRGRIDTLELSSQRAVRAFLATFAHPASPHHPSA